MRHHPSIRRLRIPAVEEHSWDNACSAWFVGCVDRLSMRELTAALFLFTSDTRLLSIAIFDAYDNG